MIHPSKKYFNTSYESKNSWITQRFLRGWICKRQERDFDELSLVKQLWWVVRAHACAVLIVIDIVQGFDCNSNLCHRSCLLVRFDCENSYHHSHMASTLYDYAGDGYCCCLCTYHICQMEGKMRKSSRGERSGF